jgi:hypothetical protein
MAETENQVPKIRRLVGLYPGIQTKSAVKIKAPEPVERRIEPDENEGQRSILPAVVFENVRVGVKLLESAFTEIGEEGSEEQFLKSLGCAVPRGTAQKSNKDNTFETARNKFLSGEGIGRVFVAMVLPVKHHEQVISEVLKTIYGQQREQNRRRSNMQSHNTSKNTPDARVKVNPCSLTVTPAALLCRRQKPFGVKALAMFARNAESKVRPLWGSKVRKPWNGGLMPVVTAPQRTHFFCAHGAEGNLMRTYRLAHVTASGEISPTSIVASWRQVERLDKHIRGLNRRLKKSGQSVGWLAPGHAKNRGS